MNIMRLRLVALTFLISNANFFLPAKSSPNQSISAESAQCRAALLRGKSKIEKFKTKVVSISQSKHSYDDGPANKPLSYTFAMTGSATKSIMSSQKFLTDISGDILLKCPSVSLLTFGFDMSDYMVTFGLMNGGKVQQFNCLEARRERVVPVRWGQVICP
jgi:hypothetical protein